MEILDNMVFVMEEGPSGESNIVAACGQHMMSWLVVRSLHNFANEFICLAAIMFLVLGML